MEINAADMSIIDILLYPIAVEINTRAPFDGSRN